MKNYPGAALAIFLMISVTDICAQIKTGYVIGLNLSTVTLKTNVYSSHPKTPVGIHFGGVVEIPLRGKFSFQPGLLFSAKGSDYKLDTTDISIAPVYIEIPANIVYVIGSADANIFLYTGPYFAFGIGGYKIEGGNELKYLRFGFRANNDLKPFDVGLNFGAGINIKGFRISASYELGLANVIPAANVISEMKNDVIGISISTLFAIK
jgi:hypothetical protein